MPELITNKKFISDLEKFKKDKTLLKKIAKALNFLGSNPYHPDLKIERITNDPSAWSARVDKRYRISFEPTAYQKKGAPDWMAPIKLLCILDHNDLYKTPH
jgi:Txe/YoeB family toxin of Txe-Axe toxin-antitoxin module